ncbi:MAG: transporter substrate-binding protein [Ferruginibacter sp.]
MANFKAYCQNHNLPDSSEERVTDDPICWAYTDVYLWAKAAEKAKSFDVAKVVEALQGLSFDSPAGLVKMDNSNHLEKAAMIGEIKPDGQFSVIWKSAGLIVPKPFFKLDDSGKSIPFNR